MVITAPHTRCLIGLFFLFAFWASAMAADISVNIDREPVRMNESFSVTFEADSWIDDDPDLAPLSEHFEILGTSQNTLLRMHDSDVTRTKTWTVRLLPKQTGNLTIPAIHFGNDVSPPAELKVVEATSTENISGGDLFVELSSHAESVYRNAQLLVTVRLFRAVNTRQSSLTELEFDGGDALIERLDEKTYESWRGGRRYAVLERRYALFPQTSGRLRIEPVEFRGEVMTRPNMTLDPFERDPTLYSNGRDIKVLVRESRPIEIEIKPPSPAAGRDWLPVRGLRLEENWSEPTPTFEVGKPVTRSLTLTADEMNAEQLPELVGEIPDALRVYPEKAQTENDKNENGISGRRTERYALIPRQPGEYRLPAIAVRWFDTARDEFRDVKIPARVINVAPAAAVQTPAGGAPGMTDEAGTTPQPLPQTDSAASAETHVLWPFISALLATGWLLTLWLWRRQRRQTPQPAEQPLRGEDSLRRLQAACAINDPVRARTTLLEWGRMQLGDPVSLASLAGHYGPPLATEIDHLNEVLYGPVADDWQGQSLAHAVQTLHKQRPPPDKTQTADLAPLYRL